MFEFMWHHTLAFGKQKEKKTASCDPLIKALLIIILQKCPFLIFSRKVSITSSGKCMFINTLQSLILFNYSYAINNVLLIMTELSKLTTLTMMKVHLGTGLSCLFFKHKKPVISIPFRLFSHFVTQLISGTGVYQEKCNLFS